ncbi:hypothetical protein AGLY_013356 [Aphis glycines]|uniref:Uncharacterized protein n=1 Tax=Aphis glycines TaxID=307491 RepID=A0A6G0T627_APHGL|nr:hypothetical protein AGLY_013356 [Aphis glycines]
MSREKPQTSTQTANNELMIKWINNYKEKIKKLFIPVGLFQLSIVILINYRLRGVSTLFNCVIGFGFVVVVTGLGVIGSDIGLRSTHLSSSDPSAHCLMPSHLLSLVTQAPYLHRNYNKVFNFNEKKTITVNINANMVVKCWLDILKCIVVFIPYVCFAHKSLVSSELSEQSARPSQTADDSIHCPFEQLNASSGLLIVNIEIRSNNPIKNTIKITIRVQDKITKNMLRAQISYTLNITHMTCMYCVMNNDQVIVRNIRPKGESGSGVAFLGNAKSTSSAEELTNTVQDGTVCRFSSFLSQKTPSPETILNEAINELISLRCVTDQGTRLVKQSPTTHLRIFIFIMDKCIMKHYCYVQQLIPYFDLGHGSWQNQKFYGRPK